MTSEFPFQDYGRARLPRGLSYVVGRDQIEAALRTAGAEISYLSLGIADVDPRRSQIMLFDVYWKGDGETRVFGNAPTSDAARLLMRWHAVPSELRRDLAIEVVEKWLPQACAWASAAAARGNAWRANDHRWLLLLSDGQVSLKVE